MDIVSHGLYGSVLFGRSSRKNFWIAFFFGIAPDLFSFGIYTVATWLGFFPHPDWTSGQHPAPEAIPQFVHTFYNFTHSFIVFGVIFLLIWLIRKKPYLLMFGWPLHILVDIPTHSDRFFPTPFLWPISDYKVNGHNWGSPEIFIPNVILLASLYLWFFLLKRRMRKQYPTEVRSE